MSPEKISVVVIGLNEERFLSDALASVLAAKPKGMVMEIFYVDSGSTDKSMEIAKSFPEVQAIPLDDPHPSAAKGRNAGIKLASGEFIQLLDGDCRLHKDWLKQALPRFKPALDLACIFGRCEEAQPQKNIYMRACQFDWHIPPGEYRLCGGNALWRRETLTQAGLFDPHLAVGEEPELCYRVRKKGYHILCLDEPMVKHDLDMITFKDYWGRATRSGRGYSIIGMRFWREEEKLWFPEFLRNFRTPMTWVIVFGLGCIWGILTGLGLLSISITTQVLRIAWKNRHRGEKALDPLIYGAHCLFSRIPLCIGQFQGLWQVWRGPNAKKRTID